MNGQEVLDIGRDAMLTLIIVAGPVMMVGLVVGLIISLLQSLTQIQEMTLTFAPKIIIMFAALIVFFPFMGQELNNFTKRILDVIIAIQ